MTLNMKKDDIDLFEEGMDWEKFAESDLKRTPTKLRRVLGDEYHEAIAMGIYPYTYFVTEYLHDFMHRVVILDPDDSIELEQVSLVPLASNPKGEFPLNTTKQPPEKLRIWFCRHKKTGKPLHWKNYQQLDKSKKSEYDRYYEQFSKREIFTLLRFAAEWNTLDLLKQESILDRLRQ